MSMNMHVFFLFICIHVKHYKITEGTVWSEIAYLDEDDDVASDIFWCDTWHRDFSKSMK